MTKEATQLPSKKRSIAALSSAGLITVIISYALAISLAVICLLLPFALLFFIPLENITFLFGRFLLSAFGLVVGFTILWSLLPRSSPAAPPGVLIDISAEPRLHTEIKAIAEALHEPMPSEIYLVTAANAFVLEAPGPGRTTRHRIMGLGLPLLQMLSIAQFRAVLAHEFAHYYTGDTRLGPWVYDARRTMEGVYRNLGRKANLLGFLRRWTVVAVSYKLLMASLRAYWKLFMRVTQAISRRQEFRSDELACYLAGSQALIDGLESICKCSAGLDSYWNSFVLPVAMGGFQPDLSKGFQEFMQMPPVVQSTTNYLKQQMTIENPSPFDSHPPLSRRIDEARRLNRPAPTTLAMNNPSDQLMISLLENVESLEAGLIKVALPALAAVNLKPLNWEAAGEDVYIPLWQKQLQNFMSLLSTKTIADLSLLVVDPGPLAALAVNPSLGRLSQSQRIAQSYDVLFCAVALCLLGNGWKLIVRPGQIVLTNGDSTIDPGATIGALRSGALNVVSWRSFLKQHGIGNWPLAVPIAQRRAL